MWKLEKAFVLIFLQKTRARRNTICCVDYFQANEDPKLNSKIIIWPEALPGRQFDELCSGFPDSDSGRECNYVSAMTLMFQYFVQICNEKKSRSWSKNQLVVHEEDGSRANSRNVVHVWYAWDN
jgi:hypothetical protein